MTTRLYFHPLGKPDWSRGEGDADLEGTTRNWDQRLLGLDPYGSANTMARTSVTDPTVGIEAMDAGQSNFIEWITEPLDRDVLISGSHTQNLWGSESSMNANAWIGCRIQRLDSQGTVQETVVAGTALGAELGTTAAVRNGGPSVTSTQFYKGDRIRARVFFTDLSPTTNMASGFTLIFRCGGATAGADGDSYIEFTENFGFLFDGPGTAPAFSPPSPNQTIFGHTTSFQQAAQPFIMPADGTVTSVSVVVAKQGSPTDNCVAAIQADASGSPSGTDLTTGSVAGTSITSTLTSTAFNVTDVALSGGTLYWLVMRRSGALNGTVNYLFGSQAGYTVGRRYSGYNGSTWTPNDTESMGYSLTVTWAYSTLYLTDVASDIDPGGVAWNSKEAWTSRGNGVNSNNTGTSTGPIAPDPIRISSALAEWYTKQLTAFTLSGLVSCNIRALETNASANAVLRAEIAVVDADGTNPVIWGAANDGVELGTTEGVMTFFVAGDDVAVTDGQRLRIRLYIDDAPGVAMATGFNVTFYWDGTTAGASGDTYITLPQTVTEYAPSPDATATPAAVAVAAAVPTPTVVATQSATATPATVAVTVAVPAPTLRSDRTASPSTVAAVASVPAPTVRGAAIGTPSTIAATASVQSPTAQGAAISTPSQVSVPVAVPTPTVIGTTGGANATASPSTVTVAAAVPSPTIQGAAISAPATVSAVTAVPAPSARGAAISSPGVVAISAAVPTPTIQTALFGQVINLVAVAQDSTSILLTWDDPDDIGHFQIERNAAILVDVAANLTATTYLDEACSPGTEYTYRVRAYETY